MTIELNAFWILPLILVNVLMIRFWMALASRIGEGLGISKFLFYLWGKLFPKNQV